MSATSRLTLQETNEAVNGPFMNDVPHLIQVFSIGFDVYQRVLPWLTGIHQVATSRASRGFWPPDLQVAPSNSALSEQPEENHCLARCLIRWVEEILHHQKDGWNPINNGINHSSTGAWFLPSTVSWDIHLGCSDHCLPAIPEVSTCFARGWHHVDIIGELQGIIFYPTLDTFVDELFVPKSVGQLSSSSKKRPFYVMGGQNLPCAVQWHLWIIDQRKHGGSHISGRLFDGQIRSCLGHGVRIAIAFANTDQQAVGQTIPGSS